MMRLNHDNGKTFLKPIHKCVRSIFLHLFTVFGMHAGLSIQLENSTYNCIKVLLTSALFKHTCIYL